MSDQNETQPVEEAPVEEAPVENSVKAPEAPQVVSQEGALVGDDALEARVVTPQVDVETVPAQVSPPREGAADKVNVHETYVAMDEVITDPSSPLAVQIPDAGRGSLDLPIHALGGRRVQDVFDEADKKARDESA